MTTVPSWLRAASITAAQTAGATVLVAGVDLLFDVQDWVEDPTNPVDISGFGKIAIGAVITAASFVVTAVYRKIKPPETTYTGPPPA